MYVTYLHIHLFWHWEGKNPWKAVPFHPTSYDSKLTYEKKKEIIQLNLLHADWLWRSDMVLFLWILDNLSYDMICMKKNTNQMWSYINSMRGRVQLVLYRKGTRLHGLANTLARPISFHRKFVNLSTNNKHSWRFPNICRNVHTFHARRYQNVTGRLGPRKDLMKKFLRNVQETSIPNVHATSIFNVVAMLHQS